MNKFQKFLVKRLYPVYWATGITSGVGFSQAIILIGAGHTILGSIILIVCIALFILGMMSIFAHHRMISLGMRDNKLSLEEFKRML